MHNSGKIEQIGTSQMFTYIFVNFTKCKNVHANHILEISGWEEYGRHSFKGVNIISSDLIHAKVQSDLHRYPEKVDLIKYEQLSLKLKNKNLESLIFKNQIIILQNF